MHIEDLEGRADSSIWKLPQLLESQRLLRFRIFLNNLIVYLII